MPSHPSRTGPILLVLVSLCALSACRKSNPPTTASIPINPFGANGCVTPDNSFGSAPAPLTLATLQVSELSQVTAATGSALLYATGVGGQVVEIDVTNPSAPVERELLTTADVSALLASVGIMDAPAVSGIAVGDESTLLVIEHTANVVLTVDRLTPGVVDWFAGLPSTLPGNADGTRIVITSPGESFPRARFSFEEPCQLVPNAPGDDAGQVFVVDSGNHSVRLISGTQVQTLVGGGTPGTLVGDFSSALFDTPSGVTVTCGGTLLVSELGASGAGQVVREISVLGAPDFTGGINGLADILIGDQMAFSTEGVSTAGDGILAQVARPSSPLATTGGEVYWIDSDTGVLRRLAADFVDCPMAADCATAVGAPAFTPGGFHALTQTPSGDIYVMDGAAGTLFRLAN